MPCNPSTQLPQNHKTAPISTCVFLFFCHPQFNCSPTAELKAPESYIYQRGSPEQNALQHLFTSDSASSMADWISDSFCFFFSAEIPQNQTKTIDKSGGSRTNMKENQIKQGGLAYLHRARRRRCTCGRGRPRPRSTAARSPRTPRSWLLLAARLDPLPRPTPSKSRGRITPGDTIRQERLGDVGSSGRGRRI